MRDETGYALDVTGPVYHVATELDRAAPAALSLDEMADSYNHPNPADLTRVKLHEGCETNRDAVLWMLERAVRRIERRGKKGAVQVVAENGGYRLADGIRFENLRFDGRLLKRIRNDHVRYDDPFNPQSGRYSDNVRRRTGKDTMDELRESMRALGWIEHLPALKDERGVVLVGHRRLVVAAELAIDPVVRTIHFGSGDEADVLRLRLALASNLGSKAFTPEERKEFAEYLYAEREWSMERIGEALGVSHDAVARDLRHFAHAKSGRVDSLGRKASTGRPRKYTPDEEQQLGELVHDKGVPMHKAQAIVRPDEPIRDWPTKATITAVERERGRREQREQQSSPADCTCPACGHVHPHA